MRESYGEGLASHTGPESCVGFREGVDEALTGVCVGPVLSREIFAFGVPMLFPQTEGHTRTVALARWCETPRGLRPGACAETLHARTGRSPVCPGRDGDQGRFGKPRGLSRR